MSDYMLLRIKLCCVFRCRLLYTITGFLFVIDAALPGAQSVQTQIRGDAAEPGLPFYFACGMRWCIVETQEHLLSDIIRLVALSCTAKGKPVDQGIIACKYCFERLFASWVDEGLVSCFRRHTHTFLSPGQKCSSVKCLLIPCMTSIRHRSMCVCDIARFRFMMTLVSICH